MHSAISHFADLEYLDQLSNQQGQILSNITDLQPKKLPKIELILDRFGNIVSCLNDSHFALLKCTTDRFLVQKEYYDQVQWIATREDLKNTLLATNSNPQA